jgi:glycerophosphoryl diester phosphodiesterase
MFANTDDYFGYSVFDGMGINKNLIKIYTVKAGDHVVLASDGYPKLFDTLKESEEYLKWVLEIDPLSIKENKQTKMIKKGNISFDDRSYLSFTIN